MLYLVGCDHDIQSSEPIPFLRDNPNVKGQRAHFLRLVDRVLLDEKVELVAEEWGRGSESFAQTLVKKHMVKYLNINTSFADLDAQQIPRDYLASPRYADVQKREWLQKRERFMLERIQS